ncbi:hypothetical protein QBZ16_004468 [Prototheca wickerhamii]|uniref:BZIP domain-containing protein n=1 Tax=Prototheca wickerhamii TaxID=3111 RepID=A0AAD9IKE8_PROWI|nr:hypothetical protein QBZ16_004468 [Prototheca wickerhamii]
MNEEYSGAPGPASDLKDVDTNATEFGNYGVQVPSSVKSEPGPASSDGLSERLAKQASLGGGNSGTQEYRDSPSPPPRGRSAAARKQTALQEKNRRAQRRFRERQKMKVAELEGQVATLTSQLERLTSEHTALAAHSQRLEAALAASAAREERAAAAAACSPRAAQDDLGRPPLAPAAPALSTTGGVPATVAEVTGSGVGGSGGAAGGEMRSGEPGSGPRLGEDEGRLPVVFQGDLRLTLRDGQSLSLTSCQLRDMTPAELARYYKTYVNELAQSLVEGGAPGPRVEALVDDVCRLWTRVGLCNPAGVKHFSLTRVEPGAGAAGGPDDRVAAVSRALDLRPDQRASLARLRALFAGKLASIRARRRAVRALAALYLASHEAARSLREALREEHILVLDFESTIFKHVLTNLQVAQLMIHSFPWTPDCLALCTWIAAEAGDADALSSLALEAQRKAAAAAAAAGVGGLSPHGGAPGPPPGDFGPVPMVGLPPRALSVYAPSPFSGGAGSEMNGGVPVAAASAAGGPGSALGSAPANGAQAFNVGLAAFGGAGALGGMPGMMPVHTAT